MSIYKSMNRSEYSVVYKNPKAPPVVSARQLVNVVDTTLARAVQFSFPWKKVSNNNKNNVIAFDEHDLKRSRV